MITTNSVTIKEALTKIITAKFVIPPFQRDYVWKEEQVTKLWDSIMMGYPISTFLFWKKNENQDATSKFLKFICNNKIISISIIVFFMCVMMNLFLIFNFLKILQQV